MTGRQGTHERPFALASRNSGEVLQERQNAERTVFFRGVRPVGVRVDNDVLVRLRPRTRQRGNQRLGRRVWKQIRFEDNGGGGASARERAQPRAGVASDIERGDVLRRTRKWRVLVRGVGVRDVGPRQDDGDGAGLLERRQIADRTTRRAGSGRELLIRGVQSPDLVLFAPLPNVDRALEDRDLALQTLEREGWISTDKDQLAGDASRRGLTRIRKVRRDRRLERRAGRLCDGDLPPA